MKGEWCYIKNFLSPGLCDKIISKCLEKELKDASVGVHSSARMDNNIRKSKVCFINKNDPEFKFLFDIIWNIALEANDEWFKFHISKLDFIQFAEYDSEYQGEFKRHKDIFWLNNNQDYHRKLSMIIQLSDPKTYRGGNFEFFDITYHPNYEEIKEQGTAIFFPSFIDHQLNPVLNGKRYSLACWFDGPKWR